MPDIISSAVIVSALTSATVALGVEWLAKPRLEARKERLLAAHRARGTIGRSLTRILLEATRLQTPVPDQLPTSVRKLWLEETRLAKDTIVATSRELEQAVADAGIPFQGMVLPLTRFANQARGIVLSDRRNHAKAELILASGSPLLDAWIAAMRPRGGLRAIGGARRLMQASTELDRLGGGDQAAHPPPTAPRPS